jgi:hypothetical protein
VRPFKPPQPGHRPPTRQVREIAQDAANTHKIRGVPPVIVTRDQTGTTVRLDEAALEDSLGIGGTFKVTGTAGTEGAITYYAADEQLWEDGVQSDGDEVYLFSWAGRELDVGGYYWGHRVGRSFDVGGTTRDVYGVPGPTRVICEDGQPRLQFD